MRDLDSYESDEAEKRNRSLIVERNRAKLSDSRETSTSRDRFHTHEHSGNSTQRRIKRRAPGRGNSDQPLYVIIDDPNQLLPKTRRVRKTFKTPQSKGNQPSPAYKAPPAKVVTKQEMMQ